LSERDTTVVKIVSEIWNTKVIHSEDGEGAVELFGLGDGEYNSSTHTHTRKPVAHKPSGFIPVKSYF
jgi:hypothetical protein